MTPENTKEIVRTAFEYLTDDDIAEVVKEWLEQSGYNLEVD